MQGLRQGFSEVDLDDYEKVAFLRNRLDFEEVLAGLNIEVSHILGSWIMCHCPNDVNHSNGDINPSFGFNPDEMRYNCFVCGGGSLLKLVKQELEVDEDTALAWLKDISSFEPAKSEDLVEKINKIINYKPLEDPLPEYPDNAVFKYRFIHPYLLKRGISREVIVKMNVGYDENHLGIVIPHWWKGKLRGWQVRHLLSDTVNGKETWFCPTCGQDNSPTVADTPKKIGKYNNTKGFPKEYTLYNYDDNLVSSVSPAVIVVESPMTVLYLMSQGFENVVATFGSLNIKQAEHLALFRPVYYWPDNDPAGAKNLGVAIKKLSQLTNLKIVPVVDKPKGDAADLEPDMIERHLTSSFSPALIPLFDKSLVTLEELRANTKE